MQIAPANVACSFEVTFDANNLHVAMSVYDVTGSTPTLVQGPSAMQLVADYTYQGKFTPDAGSKYVIIKAVYTDNTFGTLSPDYAQGSESIVGQDFTPSGGGGGGGCEVVGVVIPNPVLVGVVEC